jgi:hypothetical protein
MKLIEALVVAQQEYGIYGDWKAIHAYNYAVGRVPGGMYLAFAGAALIAQSKRLETVLTALGEQYPQVLGDERWKVARWE